MLAKRSLKIGLVLDDGLDKPDGVQQYILTIGSWLQSAGHEVHYLVGQTSRTDIKNVRSLSRNIAVRFNGNRMTIPLPTSRRRLRKFLQDNSFDVLHVQVPYSPFMAHQVIKAAPASTAIIGTFHIAPHSGLVTTGTRALGLWLKASLKRFSAIVSVSPAAADFARQTFGVESEVVPNAFNYERFHTAAPLPAYQDDKPTILFLGRLVPRKGCKVLLEAVHELRERQAVNDFRVLICGKGPLERELRDYIARHDLSRWVEMVGFLSEADKPRYYASADLSVFPSSGGESFGIVLLEAMASGSAVVLGGDNPGYKSVLYPKPELLFDPRDPVKLADIIEKYLNDSADAERLRNWGKEYTKDFDASIICGKLLAIYESALQKTRRT